MKAILPVAGYGTRLHPHTHHIQKSLLPVAGKPTLDFIVEPLLAHGIENITFIVGHLGCQIQNYMKSFDGDFHFVVQKERLGLGHAVLQGLTDSDEPVLIQLGDTIFHADFMSFCSSDVNRIAVMEVDDTTRFGIVETEGNRVVALHEKPKDPPSNLAISGLYSFISERKLKDTIEYLIEQNIRTGGEYQLTDAMAVMLKNGDPFEVEKLDYYDTGVPATFLDTNRALLKSSHEDISGCKIVDPVHIGSGCRIENSTIGPNVTIMSQCTITNCTIENSVVLQGSVLRNQLFSSRIVGADGSEYC